MSSSTMERFKGRLFGGKKTKSTETEPFHPITHTCKHCSKIVATEVEEKVLDLGVNCKEATAFAVAGCQFFKLLFSLNWSDHPAVRIRIEWVGGGAFIKFVGPEELMPKPYGGFSQARPPWPKESFSCSGSMFNIYASKDDPVFDSVGYEPSNLDPANFESQKLYAGWIESCRDQHENCRSVSNKGPSRLIKITPQGDTILAHVVQSPSPMPSFAALSYCWGGDQLKATRQYMPTLEAGLEASSFSRTVHDAIIVASNLKIEYIWVDALCIIQDDDADKIVELAKMPEIYREAFVTIMAANSEAAANGFLNRREDAMTFSLRAKLRNGSKGNVILEPIPNSLEDPVSSRAWILQEVILSSKILYFSSKQTFWFCPSRILTDGGNIRDLFLNSMFRLRERKTDEDWSEQGNELHPVKNSFAELKEVYENEISKDESQRQKFTARIEEEGPGSRREQYRNWWKYVENYSKRRLTEPDDKLIALAGIAESFSQGYLSGWPTSASYLAGVWSDNLALSLLWIRDGMSIVHRPRSYRAPSWSWAAVDTPVKCHDLFDEKDVTLQVLEASTDLVTSKLPFGSVKDGKIHLRGRVKKVTYGLTVDTVFKDSAYIELQDPVPGSYTLDAMEDGVLEGEAHPFGEHLWVLEVAIKRPRTISVTHDPISTEGLYGLILAECGKGRDVLRRIALISLSHYSPKLDSWLQSFEDREITLI